MQSSNKIITFFYERAFLLAVFLLASMYTLRFSKLDLIPTFWYVFIGMRFLSYTLVAIKFFIDFFYGKFKGYIIPVTILGLYMAYISYKSKTINYLTYFIYIVVGKDVDYLKIIKTAFLAITSSYVIVILVQLIGFIEEDFKIEGGRPRHSLGFKNAPILSNFIFYTILYYIYIRKDKLRIFESFILAIINTALLLITFTRSAFALGMIAIVAVTIVNNTKFFKTYKEWYSYPLYILPVFLPVLIVLLTVLYNSKVEFFVKLNSILNGRLALGHDAIFRYGIKLFGQYIRFSSNPSTGIAYNIVDSAYILYLLILGVVFFVLMIVFLEYFGKLINNKKDIYMLIVFVIILVHSTFDAQIFQLSNNYFMFLLSYKNFDLTENYQYMNLC